MFLKKYFGKMLDDQSWLTKRQKFLLSKLSLRSVGDLITFFPAHYEDRRVEETIQTSLIQNRPVVVQVRVLEFGSVYYRARKHPKILVEDKETRAWLVGFHRFHLKQQIKIGEVYRVYARFQYRYNEVQTSQFDIEPADKENSELFGYFLPVYGLTEKLRQKEMRKILRKALDSVLDTIEDELPEGLRQKRNLIDKKTALAWLHLPEAPDQVEKARVRLAYEELLAIQLTVQYRKARVEHLRVERSYVSDQKVTKWMSSLPYDLTVAQARSIQEIFEDMKQPYPMQRLLQGDVGSGKTTVAAAALLLAVENGYQAVLMVPTAVLARQHFKKLREQFERVKFAVELLTAETPTAERVFLLQRLYAGEALVVVGTHALFHDKVIFSKLGLVVIDEQHKFGVKQRIQLTQKAQAPDVLVMTATPIPRTLTLTVYGDLEVSVIDELPANRQPIQTLWITRDKIERVYHLVLEELKKGHQAFFVYPLIEESDKLNLKPAERAYEELKIEFSRFSVALMHGRLSNEEKEKVMQGFAVGQIQILVSTTVIEVGIDVPNATMMVVEHAERFGLSQLHQLRGRVGRGTVASSCILVTPVKVSPETQFRMETMVAFQDGFRIAEEDLKLRGPGEILGERQSGLPEAGMEWLENEHILKLARKDARAIIDYDPELKKEKTKRMVEGLLEAQWLPGYLSGG